VLEVRILGCGSSGGVPRPGEGKPYWGDCDPDNPKNRRLRCSLLVTRGDGRVLVDTSPDLHEQLLAAGIARLDGVLITHDHADQTHGIDDLRPLVMQRQGKKIDLWSDHQALSSLVRKFAYIFETQRGSGYPPIVTAHELPEPFAPFDIASVPVLPFKVQHGRIHSLGYRFGPVAYTPDCNGLDDAAVAAIEGAECWIIDALRRTPHPSHFHLEATLEWIARIRPRRAVLTNMHVDMDYDTLKRELPPNVEPAYDGMTLSFGY
jgi:phosphoribosyl 1,2-cyclic phosphate phosphodiesterase